MSSWYEQRPASFLEELVWSSSISLSVGQAIQRSAPINSYSFHAATATSWPSRKPSTSPTSAIHRQGGHTHSNFRGTRVNPGLLVVPLSSQVVPMHLASIQARATEWMHSPMWFGVDMAVPTTGHSVGSGNILCTIAILMDQLCAGRVGLHLRSVVDRAAKVLDDKLRSTTSNFIHGTNTAQYQTQSFSGLLRAYDYVARKLGRFCLRRRILLTSEQKPVI
ncbi:hypothetical protein VFPPC_15658 [Pochonia chlamydosporia 170]|uniref:Uncharacterized protein n=1 Tax=Pochonia chlamydosporia 170 TaxID=1380566 RepID=A0A179FZM2_METCM|nr:hypothetical protein VFPPC_15658 [Pochonia chlamydosporia 170]OAQ71105.1 hypothetical protein VFPPC_15658 [Pochonia chlamydosporia 170]